MSSISMGPGNMLAMLLAQVDEKNTVNLSEEGSFSYGQLKQAITKMAGFYQSKGLQSKERVMIMLPDSIAWVIAYLGAIWAGIIPIGVSPCMTGADFTGTYHLASPRLIIASTMCQTLLQAVCLEKTDIDIYFISDDSDLLGQLMYSRAVSAYHYEQDQDLFWVFTSGSSGQPKAIVHGENAILQSIRFAREVLAICAKDRLYATSRLFFAYSLANVLFAAIGCGASMILHLAWPSCEKMVATIKRYQPTIIFSVPILYRQLLARASFTSLVKNVRYCVSAGEHLPNYLAKAWRTMSHVPLMNGYGMSETLSFVLYGNISVLPGIRAVPGAMIYSSHGQPERLCFTHPGLYKRHVMLSEEGVCPEIYISDDLFVQVAPRRFQFQSRADFLFKIKGRFIHSVEEESHLLAHCAAELKDVAVICERDAIGEPQLIWCLVAGETLPLDRVEEKLAQIKYTLPNYRRPAIWRYYDILPRTSTGKLLHRQLIEKKQLFKV